MSSLRNRVCERSIGREAALRRNDGDRSWSLFIRESPPGARQPDLGQFSVGLVAASPLESRPICTWRATAIHVARATASNVPASP